MGQAGDNVDERRLTIEGQVDADFFRVTRDGFAPDGVGRANDRVGTTAHHVDAGERGVERRG